MSEIGDVVMSDEYLSCWPGDDRFAQRLYDGGFARSGRHPPARRAVLDASRARQYCQELLTHPLLCRRHPYAASVADNLKVSCDRRMRSYAGVADVRAMMIRLNPIYANNACLLHELAHLLVHANPRFGGFAPPLGFHGGAFAATMLDVVRVAHGRKERWRLRLEYLRHSVPVLTSARWGRRRSRTLSRETTEHQAETTTNRSSDTLRDPIL